MKAALLLLLPALLGPWHQVAAQCDGAGPQLQSIRAALAREQTTSADQMLDGLGKSHPDCPEIVLYRARSLYLKGDAGSAEDSFNRYISLAPDDARGYAYLGRLLLDQQQYPRADALSVQALEKNSVDPAALALRGQILGMKNQTQDGVRLLEQAVKLDPDNAEADFRLGELYAQAKGYADAVKRFERSLTILPTDASAWDYLALNLEPLGEFERADQAYRKAEAVNEQGRHYDGFIDYNYGRFLAKRNQLKEAKGRLDQAVQIAPQVRAVWYERAKVNLSMKNYQDARVDAERAASLPDAGGVILDLQMYALLQQIYQRLGETELAKKYADLSRTTPVPLHDEGR